MLGRRRSRIPIPPPEQTQRARINDKIRAPQVRLIDENGQQVGIMSIEEARSRAMAAGFDLVEVAPDAKPPVCRIMDYGKYLFEQQKKERQAKAHAHRTDIKEVRLKPATGQGDFEVKVRNARTFLQEGHKVAVQLQFRGRELAHRELGVEMLQRFATALADIARVEQEPRLEGKRLHALLAPVKR